jgi:predicted GIY-YIG superfamily endonuclease
MTKIHDGFNGYMNTDSRKEVVEKARKKLFDKEFPVPMEIVYIIKDETGEIIYVGESVNGPRRLAEHFGYDKSKAFHKGQFKKAYCKEFWTYEFIETTNKQERLIKEIELEFKHEPKYNKRWQIK